MNYKVILSFSAYNDLESIKSYISISNLVAANKYVESIFNRFETLKQFPNRGVKIANQFFDYAQARYLVCLNHVAIYKINEIAKCVYILKILSHFQDWKNIVNKDLNNQLIEIEKGNNVKIALMNPSMYFDVWQNSLDEDNRRFVPDEVFETLEEASEVVDQLIKCYNSKEGPFVYAVIRNSDNTNLGYVQLIPIEEGWEIGYHIAKRFTGHGYATEAVKLFLNYIKNNTSINELYGIVLSANKASRRVLEKTGFEFLFEGVGPYQGKRRKIVRTIKRF